MTEDQIEHMVRRFLMWKLPEDFNPDGGISFERDYNENTPFPARHEPVGTNLFDFKQAKAMVKFMLEELPATKDDETVVEAGGANDVDDRVMAEAKRRHPHFIHPAYLPRDIVNWTDSALLAVLVNS